MRAQTKVMNTESGERDGVGPSQYWAAAEVSWQKYWLWWLEDPVLLRGPRNQSRLKLLATKYLQMYKEILIWILS